MKTLFCIAIGGSLGAILRYFLSNILIGGPIGIFICNIIGSFFMGLTVGIISLKYNVSDDISKFIVIGLLGSFTTFSSYALNIFDLIEKKMIISALTYATATVLITVLALYFGMYISKSLNL